MSAIPHVATSRSMRNGVIDPSERCCGESGTLAFTRPDISTQVR
jgi:Fe-S oxidoreductase